MKNLLVILSIILIGPQILGQNPIQTKEIKIPYTDGMEVFKICTSGCNISFLDTKEYYWYNEFSQVKSTTGGSGGSLLHGNYKFYDDQGNLRQERNFYLGLLDGTEKIWDSSGNIVSQYRYKKGETIYMKFQNEEKYWIEINGPLLQEGTVRKVYTQFMTLVQEETILSNRYQKVRNYYEVSGNIKEEFTTSAFVPGYYIGKYTTYYENGNIEIDGQFHNEKYMALRTGVWKWYKSDGTLNFSDTYKADVTKWPNGEFKQTTGYVFDKSINEWIKNGESCEYSENGSVLSCAEYSWGVLVN